MPAEQAPGLGPPVAGDGVTLVPVRAGQAASVLSGELCPYVAAPGWPHSDTQHALRFLDDGGLVWLVADPAGTVVGEVGTKTPPDETGTVEIGYGLAAGSRGIGLGTRAVRTLLAALMERGDVTAVEAHVEADNAASAALLRRLGFSCTGHIADELVFRLPV